MTGAKTFWIPFGGIALVYLVSFGLLPGRGFFVTDGGCKSIQAQALLHNGFQSLAIPWPGSSLDPTARFDPLPRPFGQRRGGKLYGFYSTAFVGISAVAYAALGPRGLYVVPLLFGLALLPLTWSLAGRLPAPRRARPLAMGIVALATPVWFYSLAFWEHVPASVFLVAAVILWLRARAGGSLRLHVASGISCAMAAAFRDELYLFAACLMAASALDRAPWRGPASFGAGLVSASMPLWVVQAVALGNPLGFHLTGAGNLLARDYLQDRLEAVRVLLLQVHPDAVLSVVVGLPALLLLVFRPACAPDRHRWMWRVATGWALGLGLLVLIGGMTATIPARWLLQSNGLFAAAPVIVWGLFRTPASSRAEAETRELGRLVLLYVASYVLITPIDNVSGIHWGCRLLLPLYPLLGALAASTLAVRWDHGFSRGEIALLVSALAVSVAAQLFSLRLLDQRRRFDAQLDATVRERPQSLVAAVGWNVPMDLSGNFYEKSIFMVRMPQQLGSLLLFLRDAGATDVLVVSAVSLRGLPLANREQLVDPTGFTMELGSIDVTNVAPSGE